MKGFIKICCLCWLVWFALPARAEIPLRFAVLVTQPKQQLMTQWQPLVKHLEDALERQIELRVYNDIELDQALANNAVDILLSDPAHVLLAQHRHGASAPLLTLLREEQQQELAAFGGVIFTRSDRTDLNVLADLKNQRIALASLSVLGAYSMQAYELMQAHEALPNDEQLLLTGLPFVRVIDAVLSGRADVGFVRTGVLEGLAREGQLDLAKIKVLHRQNLSHFPYASSTRLYPEWPVVVLPQVNEHLARRLVVALLSLQNESAVAQAAGIHGFSIPSNYDSVQTTLQRLRLPPFEVAPEFTWSDLWDQYAQWLVALLCMVILLIALSFGLLIQMRRARQHQRQFEMLFEACPDPLVIVAQGRFVDCNQAAVDGIAYPNKEAVLRLTALDVSPEYQPDGELSRVKLERLIAAASAGETQRYEWQQFKGDGTAYTVWSSLVCISYQGQDAFLIAARDITDLKLTQGRLIESEERLRLAIQAANQGMYDWDLLTGEVLVSPEYALMLGYDPDQFHEKYDKWSERLHPDDRESVNRLYAAYLNGDAPVFRVEFRQRTQSGAWKWILSFGKIVARDRQGNPVRMLGLLMDITERKQAEAELAQYHNHLEEMIVARTLELSQAKTAAEAASVAKSAFLANMSHEFRTPLNAIVGMGHLIRRAGVTEKQAEYLDKGDAAAQHLSKIIDAILDFSKLESGKLHVNEAEVRVDMIAHAVASQLAESAHAKQLQMLSEVQNPSCRVMGDPVRIQQALFNYVSNAIKFTDRGTVTIRTRIKNESPDHILMQFEVEDTGVGILPEDVPRLFSAFEQADNSMTRKYGGTGFGLAITRSLAELMGGSAGVFSEPKVGSTFWFTVKLKKAPVVVAAPAQITVSHDVALPVDQRLKQEFRGRRVLVVDDEQINQELARLILEDVGLVVDIADDGLAAVNMVAQRDYDLILMDLQMPRMGGLEAVRRIRRQASGQRVPILAVTANVFVENKARCFEVGMQDFIGKPFYPEVLYAMVLKWLAQAPVLEGE